MTVIVDPGGEGAAGGPGEAVLPHRQPAHLHHPAAALCQEVHLLLLQRLRGPL